MRRRRPDGLHAEGSGDGPAVLGYATSAAHRAAELASHREAAAQFERALRFTADADPAAVAGLYDGLAYEVSLLDQWQDAADARERALELWRAAGDRLREGGTLRQLARAMGHLCRGSEAIAAAEAAVSILEPLGPSAELAWAYAGLAAQQMMNDEHDTAIGLALRAQAIAAPLGIAEVLSDALNTEGCAAASLGREWTGKLNQALEIAIAERRREQAGRAFVNLYSMHNGMRRFAEGERYFADGVAYCDEHDIATYAVCLRSERTRAHQRRDRRAAVQLRADSRSLRLRRAHETRRSDPARRRVTGGQARTGQRGRKLGDAAGKLGGRSRSGRELAAIRSA